MTLDDGDAQLPPLFVAEFLLEPNSILFRPDIDDFQVSGAVTEIEYACPLRHGYPFKIQEIVG